MASQDVNIDRGLVRPGPLTRLHLELTSVQSNRHCIERRVAVCALFPAAKWGRAGGASATGESSTIPDLMSRPSRNSLSYRNAGVDIERGHDLVARIRGIADKTPREGVIAGLGGFGALFKPPLHRYQDPVLVSGTDGVGTKLKLAIAQDRHDTIGIDLVAMCVNDIITHGAEPMFFLDYFAAGRLDVGIAERVVAGIGRGCELAGAALVGGETAEMPGMYTGGEYDLAGFCVGIVERGAIIDGARVTPGDRVVAIASSGPHSNGYSLIRRILDASGEDLDRTVGGVRLGDALLAPTRIYAASVLPLTRDGDVHAIAHVTGGGIVENLPRVLPQGTRAVIDASSWRRPAVFEWIRDTGGVAEDEMWRTFNCGAGMLLVAARDTAGALVDTLEANGEHAWVAGRIDEGEGAPEVRVE